MTNTIDFVKSLVDRIVKLVPYVKCRYEYHEASYTHFIEVVPSTVYKFNSDYLAIEEIIATEFEEKYPTEFICFITDDSVYEITTPVYVKHGNGYGYDVRYISELEAESYSYLWDDNWFLNDRYVFENEAIHHESVTMTDNRRGCFIRMNELPPDKRQEKITNELETPFGVSFFL